MCLQPGHSEPTALPLHPKDVIGPGSDRHPPDEPSATGRHTGMRAAQQATRHGRARPLCTRRHIKEKARRPGWYRAPGQTADTRSCTSARPGGCWSRTAGARDCSSRVPACRLRCTLALHAFGGGSDPAGDACVCRHLHDNKAQHARQTMIFNGPTVAIGALFPPEPPWS